MLPQLKKQILKSTEAKLKYMNLPFFPNMTWLMR